MSDPGWILTKNSIVSKVVGLMGEMADVYRGVLGGTANPGTMDLGTMGFGFVPGDPKVSRGENYRGLPWVMLDYPRVFGREDVLAIRTMFWWGHGFSVTLHVKGKYLSMYLPVILARRAELGAAGFHVGVHADEWRHEHTREIFLPVSEVDGSDWGRHGFLKLSGAFGLDRWAEAPELLAGLYRTLVGVLCASW